MALVEAVDLDSGAEVVEHRAQRAELTGGAGGQGVVVTADGDGRAAVEAIAVGGEAAHDSRRIRPVIAANRSAFFGGHRVGLLAHPWGQFSGTREE